MNPRANARAELGIRVPAPVAGAMALTENVSVASGGNSSAPVLEPDRCLAGVARLETCDAVGVALRQLKAAPADRANASSSASWSAPIS